MKKVVGGEVASAPRTLAECQLRCLSSHGTTIAAIFIELLGNMLCGGPRWGRITSPNSLLLGQGSLPCKACLPGTGACGSRACLNIRLDLHGFLLSLSKRRFSCLLATTHASDVFIKGIRTPARIGQKQKRVLGRRGSGLLTSRGASSCVSWFTEGR